MRLRSGGGTQQDPLDARPPDPPHEIIYDEADRLDRPTLCKLSLIRVVEVGELHLRRGRVCAEHQRQMGGQLIRLYGLWRG